MKLIIAMFCIIDFYGDQLTPALSILRVTLIGSHMPCSVFPRPDPVGDKKTIVDKKNI